MNATNRSLNVGHVDHWRINQEKEKKKEKKRRDEFNLNQDKLNFVN